MLINNWFRCVCVCVLSPGALLSGTCLRRVCVCFETGSLTDQSWIHSFNLRLVACPVPEVSSTYISILSHHQRHRSPLPWFCCSYPGVTVPHQSSWHTELIIWWLTYTVNMTICMSPVQLSVCVCVYVCVPSAPLLVWFGDLHKADSPALQKSFELTLILKVK